MNDSFVFDNAERTSLEFTRTDGRRVLIMVQVFHSMTAEQGSELMDDMSIAIALKLREGGWK